METRAAQDSFQARSCKGKRRAVRWLYGEKITSDFGGGGGGGVARDF